MLEGVQVFGVAIDLWIAAMLTVQSFILYRLLPEIRKVSNNSDALKTLNIFAALRKRNGQKGGPGANEPERKSGGKPTGGGSAV